MKTYDPAGIVLTVGGVISGYAKGTFVEAGRNEETFKLVVGADGTAVRVRNRNVSGRIKLTLMQTSDSNNMLSALWQLDEASGEGVVPVLLADLNGVSLVSSAEGWVTKPADQKYGDDLTDREWVIEMGAMSMQ